MVTVAVGVGDGLGPPMRAAAAVHEHNGVLVCGVSAATVGDVTWVTQEAPVLATQLAQRLLDGLDEVTDELVARILASDYAYAEARQLTDEQLRSTVADNLATILAQLAGRAPMRLEPPRAAGRLKAEQGVPLAALLHAYRLGGRLIWERVLEQADGRIADALPPMASEIWGIIDEYSSAAAEAYGAFIAERARLDARARSLMLSALLEGNITNAARLWDSLRTLQLPEVGTFLVVSAEVGEQGREPLHAIDERLRRCEVHSLWTVERDAQVGLLSLISPRQHDDICGVLAEVATTRVGVSRPFGSPTQAHEALREAQLASRCTTPGRNAVVRFGTTPIPLLLANQPDAGRQLADQVLAAVLQLPDSERDTLLDTLETWYACAGSSSDAAKRLHYHRNTIHHRLRRLEQLTGRSCSDPVGSAELYVALTALRLTRPH